MSQVAEDKIVTFHYTLKNKDGEVLDTSSDGDPHLYLQGAGNIVPGLERQMEGKSVGDKFKAEVAPEDGYGLREGPGPQPIGRDSFPLDAEIEEGMVFLAETPDGQSMPLWVTDVKEDVVFVDTDHPLAGETLYFDVEIVGVRDAKKEELEHGHPHGPHGDEAH
ncbi:MAG: FKBP-type peptidyl-prolyl cis-trans isomerase [Bradymonadaceae bacterium]